MFPVRFLVMKQKLDSFQSLHLKDIYGIMHFQKIFTRTIEINWVNFEVLKKYNFPCILPNQIFIIVTVYIDHI